MRTYWYSPRLATFVAIMGFAATAPFAGCGGDAVTIKPNGTGGDGGGGGGDLGVCGNGKLESAEACDDGNLVGGDGCEPDCSYTCNNASPATGDAKCDDMDPCNGQETCLDDHTCSKGTAADDGKDCGNGQICVAGVCSPDQCGDLFKSESEECDDGNVTNGDGCNDCKFSCLSSDPLRDCTNLDPCLGTVCDDATHTCGNPLGEGAYCGQGQVCKGGTCTPTVCGDGVLEFGEVCDDGNLVDGDGCDANCTLSCVDPAADCPIAPTCQIAACSAANVCTTNPVAVDPACVAPSSCQNGACQAPTAVCGNGFLEIGEACDFGAGNGTNTGCEDNCTLSCMTDVDCNDMNTCDGTETCTDTLQNGQIGRRCAAGMNEPNCSACAGGLCNNGTCTASACGDGCLDTMAGEQCEPPGSATCDAMCKTIIVAICGNGTREPSEQCDDGNTTNLDGCSATCTFEQLQRANWLAMQYGTDTYCTANRLGSAIATAGQSTISDAITASVKDGSITIIFQMLDLDDLSGTSDPMLQLGSTTGIPIIPAGTVYDGAADLDWWYTIDTLTLDAARVPTGKLSASIAGKTLNAGPGSLFLTINLGGVPAPLNMNNVKIEASIGNATMPLVSMGAPPGHLASENLDPALQSFETMGQPNANGAAKLCGNVSAASLAQVPVPAVLLSGSTACSQGYTAANSLLDVIVGGCTALGIIPVIIARQPDTHDPNLTNLGAGPPYTLTRNTTTKQVNGCRDMNNVAVPLFECLQDAAYSAYFKFATDRVIGK
ncbi:MAG: DUF4215 domain-containing protein [Polyangiaceae bacterium]|nr:DUF4215 domain-containing protein [Polyangiaceae bacterium]